MTVRPLEPITIWRAACDVCTAILKDALDVRLADLTRIAGQGAS